MSASSCILQKAQSKKGKGAEKSPQDEQPPNKMESSTALELDQKISAQGVKIRQLKADKAPKVHLCVA